MSLASEDAQQSQLLPCIYRLHAQFSLQLGHHEITERLLSKMEGLKETSVYGRNDALWMAVIIRPALCHVIIDYITRLSMR